MKVSIVVPVYQDGDILHELYDDLKKKVFSKNEFDYELILVNDGSTDNTLDIMKELQVQDDKIRICNLSRNFGAYSASLAGLAEATGDCVVAKAADLQEPSELIFQMVDKWKQGYNVVLAVREERKESKRQVFFSNAYYHLVRRYVSDKMPRTGFDVYLLDKKVVKVLLELDERNSSLILQILWCGFRTAQVPYVRQARQNGESKWTMKKKIRLAMDTFISFSTFPIKLVSGTGILLSLFSLVTDVIMIILKIINASLVKWSVLGYFFLLFFIGTVLISVGILGEYIWRTLDASRNRPVYITEDVDENDRS